MAYCKGLNVTIKYETNATIELAGAPLSGSENLAIVYRVRNSFVELRQGRTSVIRLDKKQLQALQSHIETICNDLEQ
jgi:hypothetical protein